jgi:hypothetical protein
MNKFNDRKLQMKSRKLTIMSIVTLLALTSATAFSGSQGDYLMYVCQYCYQVKAPSAI